MTIASVCSIIHGFNKSSIEVNVEKGVGRVWHIGSSPGGNRHVCFFHTTDGAKALQSRLVAQRLYSPSAGGAKALPQATELTARKLVSPTDSAQACQPGPELTARKLIRPKRMVVATWFGLARKRWSVRLARKRWSFGLDWLESAGLLDWLESAGLLG